jgi:hypothetical protein
MPATAKFSKWFFGRFGYGGTLGRSMGALDRGGLTHPEQRHSGYRTENGASKEHRTN